MPDHKMISKRSWKLWPSFSRYLPLQSGFGFPFGLLVRLQSCGLFREIAHKWCVTRFSFRVWIFDLCASVGPYFSAASKLVNPAFDNSMAAFNSFPRASCRAPTLSFLLSFIRSGINSKLAITLSSSGTTARGMI